eukprot:CAMPEP_0115614564 /NCGR_PEP_ID=MMETSP0272-20121206/22171_1 /TAXON_ID=71861 /ORGANISM="Scrippsiella trochoidea, Strain CCMP3099" /LENGTH=133 /DNA_ID=CAMNT_0003050447 /DNA_START=1144 /DNA_END=1546 /DNA_ORIENTATION=-
MGAAAASSVLQTAALATDSCGAAATAPVAAGVVAAGCDSDAGGTPAATAAATATAAAGADAITSAVPAFAAVADSVRADNGNSTSHHRFGSAGVDSSDDAGCNERAWYGSVALLLPDPLRMGRETRSGSSGTA